MLLLGIFVFYSCKKFTSPDSHMAGRRSSSNGANSLELVTCSRTLPNTISSNRTLNPDSAYLITNCVKVTNGATLTIPAGTVLLGQKSTNGTLVIERGAKIVANGTAMNPVVFTSDQPVNSRAPGDWGGLIIAGKASNNSTAPSSNVIEVDRACGTITAGAVSGVTTDTDDSGTLSYVQIHYAGGAVSGDEIPSALLLAAVGSNTDIDHVQITHSAKDGMVAYGGRVNATYVANYDNYKVDFRFDQGYRGNLQFGLSVRLDANAHDPNNNRSNAVVISNEPGNGNLSPYTNAVLSNITILGPAYCGGSSLSGDFRNGVLFTDYAKGGVFNSLIAGWPQGMRVEGNNAITNANNGDLKFSYNTFYGYGTTASQYAFTGSSWDQPSGACVDNMTDWIENPDNLSCANFGYEALTSGLGYSNSICGNYCSSAPSFALGSTSMSNSSYPSGSMVDLAFFNKSTKPRGGFNGTDWTAGWTDFCPQATGYCI